MLAPSRVPPNNPDVLCKKVSTKTSFPWPKGSGVFLRLELISWRKRRLHLPNIPKIQRILWRDQCMEYSPTFTWFWCKYAKKIYRTSPMDPMGIRHLKICLQSKVNHGMLSCQRFAIRGMLPFDQMFRREKLLAAFSATSIFVEQEETTKPCLSKGWFPSCKGNQLEYLESWFQAWSLQCDWCWGARQGLTDWRVNRPTG